MIVDKIINTTEKTELEVINATLLEIEDAKKLPDRLKKYDSWWWLQSYGYRQDLAATVFSFGSINFGGNYVNYEHGRVRPVLVINLNSSNFEIGDCFYFKNKEFEIISENLAFCKTDIGYHIYDKEINIYENSEIKNYIDNWFKN